MLDVPGQLAVFVAKLLWVSPVLPGGVHDITAAREHVLAVLRPLRKNLPVLADSG